MESADFDESFEVTVARVSSTSALAQAGGLAFNEPPHEFDPTFGRPGDVVTLFGRHFDGEGLSVRFGDVEAGVVGEPTATRVTVKVPEMDAGSVLITIETDAGSGTSRDEFTVLQGSNPTGGPE